MYVGRQLQVKQQRCIWYLDYTTAVLQPCTLHARANRCKNPNLHFPPAFHHNTPEAFLLHAAKTRGGPTWFNRDDKKPCEREGHSSSRSTDTPLPLPLSMSNHARYLLARLSVFISLSRRWYSARLAPLPSPPPPRREISSNLHRGTVSGEWCGVFARCWEDRLSLPRSLPGRQPLSTLGTSTLTMAPPPLLPPFRRALRLRTEGKVCVAEPVGLAELRALCT